MELFDLPETPSPYLEFRRRFNIHVRYENNDEGLMPYTATIGPLEKQKDENAHGYGCTEREAVFSLAKRMNLGNWRELNWDER